MQLNPEAKDFNAQAGKARLVWTKLVLDLETPVSAMLKLMQPDEPCFLLESVEGGAARGRYSIIGLKPDLIWKCEGSNASISRSAPFDKDSFEPAWDDSLSSLKKLAREMAMDIPEGLPPMAAGIIGYLGYPAVGLTEKLPDTNPDPIAIPDGMFMRPTQVLIFDSVDGVVYVIALVWPDHERSYDEISRDMQATVRLLRGPVDQRHQHNANPDASLNFEPQMTKADYFAMVDKAKEYIAAGDIFQVVPSQRFSADFAHHPFALYRSLRRLNPSPFLFYLHFPGFTLVGSSPEILVRVRDDTVTIRPIAGTRPRGKSTAEDLALEQELLDDAKECAEHLMLLDLGRNDVGRVCVKDSVKVTEQMIIERYSHVMHIVSNVEGTLDRERYDAIDALFAGFPAGTVSGAPKIRAMEIIDELEPVRRSFYAGGTGYIGAGGSLDICINLRTALVKDGKVYAHAGGGVVADSDPEAEFQESVNKAKAVMKAAELAGEFGSG